MPIVNETVVLQADIRVRRTLNLAWSGTVIGAVCSQVAWLNAVSHYGEGLQGLGDLYSVELALRLLAPAWLALCLGLVLYALHSAKKLGCAVDSLSHWALPGLAIWSATTLVHVTGWANITAPISPDEPGGPGVFLAVTRLDHPWPIFGAAATAVLCAVGIARAAPDQPRNSRALLLALALWAGLRSLCTGLEWWLAHRVLADVTALNGWRLPDHLFGAILVAALIGLLACGALAIRAALRQPPIARPTSLVHPPLAILVAILCAFEASRLPEVTFHSRANRLHQALQSTATSIPTHTTLGGAVPENLVILQSNGSLTLVQPSATQPLPSTGPIGGHGLPLTLMVDEHTSLAELLPVVKRFTEETPLRLAYLNEPQTWPFSAWGSLRAMRTTIRWVGFATQKSALIDPNAPPFIDLTQLPATTSVAGLDLTRPLSAPRTAGSASTVKVPIHHALHASLWDALSTLYVFGW